MHTEQFAALRALYDRLVDLTPEARRAVLLAEAIPATLAAEVSALCAASDLDNAQALDSARDSLLGELAHETLQPGDVLGAWRIVDQIGHGGMGHVYRVERNDGHYTQHAALKFIRGLAPAQARTLFNRERQVLARLQHAGIARLLDGGATPGGQPYLVMEYVDGRPIDIWCREHAPTRDRILDLFVTTCAAVSYAHRQLVVHCDLKPANILVTSEGAPVLLDFGIAQLSDRIAEETDAITPQAFTPGYASPEQKSGERIGIASDVYSLGVLLDTLLHNAGIRRSHELAAILGKATHTAPGARYATVDALCEDLVRMRRHRPVQALPQRLAYRLSRFLRRRWAPVLVASMGLLLTAGFTLAVLEEGRRARAAEQVALAERDRARQAESQARAAEVAARETSGFLISVFRGGNPDAGSGTVSLAALLDAALLRVERDLADTPATQSQLMATLAQVLFVIGQPDRGQQLYTRAIELERSQQRPLVLAEMLLGNAHELRRDRASAIDHEAVLEGLRLVDAHAVIGSPLHFELRLSAASILGQIRRPEADAVFEAAVQDAREHHPGSVALANALAAHGWHLRRLNDYTRAIDRMRESLDLRRLLLGDAHVDYVAQIEALAGTLQLARRFAEAEPLFDEALALHRRDGRLASRQGAWSLVQYATLLGAAGRAMEAIPLIEEAFSIGRQKFPGDSPTFRVWLHNLAEVVAATGDVPRATALVDQSIAAALAEGHSTERARARSLILKARILRQNGCDAGAGAAVDDALRLLSNDPAPDVFDIADARLVRTQWLLDCGHVAQAQAELDSVSAQPAQLRPGARQQLPHTMALLALWRDGDAAALSRVVEAERILAEGHAPGDPRAALARLPRAEWLHAQKRHAEASALAEVIRREIGERLVADAALRQRLAALRQER